MKDFSFNKESWQNILEQISDIFNYAIFHLGKTEVTPASIIYFLFFVLLLVYLSGKIKYLLVNRILTRYKLDIGVRQSIGTIVRYILLIIGFFIIIQTAGIDLTSLGILAGALGVGIGFGLQNITNNFISGIIILFERPVKVGDRIEVAQTRGDVVKISARATTVVTNDNISVIVPNSELISTTVINWSHNDRLVRFNFPVYVAYKENPEYVKKLLMEVVAANEGVLKIPAPDVLFEDYGDSSLTLNLRVWTSKFTDRPNVLKSQLYYAVFKKFRENNIEIPFPQRDIHIKSGSIGSIDADKIK